MYRQPYEQLEGKDIEWEGWYEQHGQRQPMKFDNMHIGLNGVIEGSGSDTVGSFRIFGQVTRHGSVNFTKQYIGKHSVAYQGVIQDSKMSGNWRIGNYSGNFEIKYHLEEWQGHYQYQGRRYNMKLDLDVDTAGVFGIDKDQEGVFVIRGQYSNQTYKIQFTRQYIGGNTQYFQGDMTNNGRFWVVKGQWQFAGGSGGEFELYKEAPPDQQFQNQQQQQQYRQENPQMRWMPPPVVIQAPPPMIIMQPGIIPMQMPMMQGGMMQGGMMQGGGQQQPQQNNQQLSGYIEEFEILDGETEDCVRIIDLLKRGKRFTGEILADFIERISFPEDLETIVNFVPEYLDEFKDDHLYECVAECDHPQCRPLIVEKLFPKVDGHVGAIMKNKIMNKMQSQDDRDKVANIMGF